MKDFAEGALGVAAVGAGQAMTDELVEALAKRYGADKGFIIHLLIEAGVPIAIGVGTHYATDNQMARNVGIGILAAGSVNGARLAVQKVKDMLASDGDGGDTATDGLGSIAASLSPAQRRAVAALPPRAIQGFRQLGASQQRDAARQLVARQSGRNEREQVWAESEPMTSGTLGQNKRLPARRRGTASGSVRSV